MLTILAFCAFVVAAVLGFLKRTDYAVAFVGVDLALLHIP